MSANCFTLFFFIIFSASSPSPLSLDLRSGFEIRHHCRQDPHHRRRDLQLYTFISGDDGGHGVIGEEFRFLGKGEVQADQEVGSIRYVRWWRSDGEEAE
ncbi:uncharacterized protein G2W53_020903 [Senna tora]|uniref:Uncharacterized protein n=1 Tax=Senna tora TaxID=362788 RepID=A0A834TKG5_9FABA|nr:uncharacterized protein G2W53_020903 [Senna tora]